MTRSTGTAGLISLGISAEAMDRGTHRRQIHDRRNAGEVLQHHPRRLEWNLLDRWGSSALQAAKGGHVFFRSPGDHHSCATPIRVES